MRILAPLRRITSFGGKLSVRERYQWVSTFHNWKKEAFSEHLPTLSTPDTVAIVLSFQRPYNIDAIVRVLLRTPSIAKVIVSNNNPAYRMTDWLSVRSPRLSVLEQPIPRPRHIRFGLADRETGYTNFLAVDDDVFLKPSQLEVLCTALRLDPSRPHGVTGVLYDSWRGMLYHNMNSRTAPVDVLNRVYAFTSTHVDAFFGLLREAGFGPTHSAWTTSYWDDIFLSFCTNKPMVQYTGPYLNCPSQNQADIAVSTRPEVMRLRLSILLMLRRMRPKQG